MTKRTGTQMLDQDAGAAPVTPAPAPRRASTVGALIAANGGLVQHVPLALIDPHPDNPREQLGDLAGLVASISSPVGLMQPLTVATSRAFWAARGRDDVVDDGRFVVLAGHRRRAALEQAGRTDAPCLVRDDLAGDDAVVAMLIENLHREDLESLEEARGFAKLRELGLTQTQIAAKVGCSQPHVSKRMALLRLPDEVRAKVAEHAMRLDDAAELAKYADEPDVVTAIVADRRSYESVDETAERIREQREEERALETVRERLRGEGVKRFVTTRPAKYTLEAYLQYGRGAMSLADLKTSGVDVRDHDALACHAVVVAADWRGGVLDPEPVCTKPKNHAGAVEAKRDRAAERAQRAAEKAAAQAGARRELARALLTGKPDRELSELVDTLVIRDLSRGLNRAEEVAILARLLDIPGPRPGRDDHAIRAEIQATVDKATPAARARIIAALVLTRCELDIDRDYGDHAAAGAYLRFLQSHGHTLAGVERKHVGRS